MLKRVGAVALLLLIIWIVIDPVAAAHAVQAGFDKTITFIRHLGD